MLVSLSVEVQALDFDFDSIWCARRKAAAPRRRMATAASHAPARRASAEASDRDGNVTDAMHDVFIIDWSCNLHLSVNINWLQPKLSAPWFCKTGELGRLFSIPRRMCENSKTTTAQPPSG